MDLPIIPAAWVMWFCVNALPTNAKILSVHIQDDDICMWVEMDPSALCFPRHFAVYSTGAVLPDMPGRFLGTVLLRGSTPVFHIYEQIAP